MLFLSLEVCRGFAFLILIIVLAIRMFPHCISLLRKNSNQVRSLRMLYLHRYIYIQIQLVVKIIADIQKIITSLLMGIGLILGVCFNFATFKLHQVLINTSVIMFLMCALMSALIPIIVAQALPYAINCHINSKLLLEKWKFQVFKFTTNRTNRKYALKQLKSMKTIDFHAGVLDFNFFVLKNSTKIRYYWAMTDYTVTALKTFPEVNLTQLSLL